MKNLKIIYRFILTIICLTSCATSMTPTQVSNTLPTYTASKYYNQTQANEAQNNNKCKLLVKGRNYVAPIGLSVHEDLRNGAKGIDEWVRMDGGNAYILINYKWVTVDFNGTTQLYIDFDTMRCD